MDEMLVSLTLRSALVQGEMAKQHGVALKIIGLLFRLPMIKHIITEACMRSSCYTNPITQILTHFL